MLCGMYHWAMVGRLCYLDVLYETSENSHQRYRKIVLLRWVDLLEVEENSPVVMMGIVHQ
jgi:hypothetical protein